MIHHGLTPVELSLAAAVLAAQLSDVHRGPRDRFIIATVIRFKALTAPPDKVVGQYDVVLIRGSPQAARTVPTVLVFCRGVSGRFDLVLPRNCSGGPSVLALFAEIPESTNRHPGGRASPVRFAL